MGTPPLTREIAQHSVDVWNRHNQNVTYAADELGISRGTLQSRLRAASRYGLCGYAPVPPGFEIKQISTSTNADGSAGKTYVKTAPERGDVYAPIAGHNIKGESALIDADGRIIQKWVKTSQAPSTQDTIEAIRAAFEDYRGLIEPVELPDIYDEDVMAVYPIVDAHHGLLAWSPEAGENYDLEIGHDRLRSCMRSLVAQSGSAGTALLINLGDWTHTDSDKNMTPASNHILDADGRFYKIVKQSTYLMRECIDLLLMKHARVMVVNIAGNHDRNAYVTLPIALSMAYEKEPRVTILDNPSAFFFMRFGETLIGATHGDKIKPPDMAMNMAIRKKEDWALSKYRWFLFGHIHHETVKEVHGVRCESFQTLAAKDAYSAGAGYNSGQSLSCIKLHKERGEIGRSKVNI